MRPGVMQLGERSEVTMARKELSRPVDDNSTKNPDRHKEFSKPVIDSDALRIIGRAYDQGIIKQEEVA